MKPLLRAVLVVDVVLLLVVGGLFLLSPWRALFDALQLASVEPPMIGQVLGIALLGFAWLALLAAIDGDLTSRVARAVSHVNWLAGAVALIWVIALRNPPLAGFGLLVAGVTGAVFVIVGFGGARLAAVVRRREKTQALDARESKRVPEPAAMAAEPRVEPTVGGASAPAAAHVSAAQPERRAAHGAAGFDEARPPLQD